MASQYVVEYQPPTYDVNALQHVTNYSTVEETNPGFIERYTQLPNTLPERVKELATQLTEGKTTVYEQVIAIENYLQGPNFTYRTHDIAVPGRHQDYVDQFLLKQWLAIVIIFPRRWLSCCVPQAYLHAG